MILICMEIILKLIILGYNFFIFCWVWNEKKFILEILNRLIYVYFEVNVLEFIFILEDLVKVFIGWIWL